MDIKALEPFGGAVDRCDIRRVRADEAREIVRHVARHRVLVLHGQTVDPSEFATFLRKLGELTFTRGETPVPGAPDLNIVTNVGLGRTPRSVFHTDTSYVESPPAMTALCTVTVPATGGETLFSDQVRALERLDPIRKAQIEGRTMRHAYDRPDGVVEAHRQPIVIVHPLTRERALYLSTPERCSAIDNMSDDASRELIEDLYSHSIDPAHLYTHRWQLGDVVIWDDRVTMHRADHSAVSGDRTLHRGLIAGTPLESAATR